MIKYLTSIIGILTAGLYVHGSAFWFSYLDAMNIPPSLFQLNFEETLSQGYIAYTLLGFPLVLMTFIGVVLVLMMAFNINELSKMAWVKTVISFLSKGGRTTIEEIGHPTTEKSLHYSKKATIFVGAVTLIVCVAFGMLIQVSELGKTSGTSQLTELSNALVNDVIYLIDEESITGTLLTCSNSFCAIYSDKETVIIPLLSIEKIVSPHVS